MEVPKIFRKKEKPLDNVSTSDVGDIDFDKMTDQSKDVNQKWLDKSRKENEKQAEKDKPRLEALEKITTQRKEAEIEKDKVNRIQGLYNAARVRLEEVSLEMRGHEKEIAKIGGWKRIPADQEKPMGTYYKKWAVWKKDFACFEKTPYELEEQAIRMKATGHVLKNGEWVLSEERKKLNAIIAQEIRKN